MPSSLDNLAGSLHRAILGGLLAVLVLLSAGTARTAIPAGNYLLGVPSAVAAVAAAAWVVALFVEGLRER